MKRRPRLLLKPNIPSKSGANKIDAPLASNDDSASAEAGVTQYENADRETPGENVSLQNTENEPQSMAILTFNVTNDSQSVDNTHSDQSGLQVIVSENLTEGIRTEEPSEKQVLKVGQLSESGLRDEDSLCMKTSSINDPKGDECYSGSLLLKPLTEPDARGGCEAAFESCTSVNSSVSLDHSIKENISCKTTSCKAAVEPVKSITEQRSDSLLNSNGQGEGNASEQSSCASGIETKPSRRFTRIRPNLSNISRPKQSSSAETSSSATKPDSKSQNKEMNPSVPEQDCDAVENKRDDSNLDTVDGTGGASVDIVSNVGTDTEAGKPSETIDDGINSSAAEHCKSTDLPVSPPGAAMRIPHQFTKMRPNLPQNAKTKKSSGAESLSTESALNLEDEPFVPPPAVPVKQPSCGIEVSIGDSVACEESVVILPESAVKAAAKVIERKLKEKRKKRAVENIETPVDSSKVCMRDLIYMNPVNNPMKSKSAEAKSISSTSSTSVSASVSSVSVSSSQTDSALPKKSFSAPQLKINEDGSIVLDEASLIIERQPVKTYDHIEAIDETDMVRCGYPKKTRTRAWNKKETRKFFAALSMIGTDFFLMAKFFRKRTRTELKSKFKREEKIHSAMVETALKERRNLDMSVMMAVDSSDDEDVKPKAKPAGKPGRKRTKKQVCEDDNDTNMSTGGKENEPQMASAVKTEKKRKRETDKQFGRKQKKSKSRYYEESSDEAEIDEETEIDASSVTEEDTRLLSKRVSSVKSSDDEEVEIVNYLSRRPTRSGRIPKPVKMFNEVRSLDDEDLMDDSDEPAPLDKPVPKEKKLPNFQAAFSASRSSGLTSPLPLPSTSCAPDASVLNLRSPIADVSFGSSTFVPAQSLISCAPSAELPFIPANIPPGKQLMILASPIIQNESREPAQVLLDFLLISSPQHDLDCRDQNAAENILGENTTAVPVDSLLSPQHRTMNHESYVACNTTVPFSGDNFTVLPVATTQQFTNCTGANTKSDDLYSVDFTQNGTFNSSDRLSVLSTVCADRSCASEKTLPSDLSVSPMLSLSALEYCATQVSNMEHLSLDFSSMHSPRNDQASEEDSDLEGTVTDIVQQDDGTLVLVAESIRTVNHADSEQPRLGSNALHVNDVAVSSEQNSKSCSGTVKLPTNTIDESKHKSETNSDKNHTTFITGPGERLLSDENFTKTCDEFIEFCVDLNPLSLHSSVNDVKCKDDLTVSAANYVTDGSEQIATSSTAELYIPRDSFSVSSDVIEMLLNMESQRRKLSLNDDSCIKGDCEITGGCYATNTILNSQSVDLQTFDHRLYSSFCDDNVRTTSEPPVSLLTKDGLKSKCNSEMNDLKPDLNLLTVPSELPILDGNFINSVDNESAHTVLQKCHYDGRLFTMSHDEAFNNVSGANSELLSIVSMPAEGVVTQLPTTAVVQTEACNLLKDSVCDVANVQLPHGHADQSIRIASLPDGSVEVILDEKSWTGDNPGQSYYVDIPIDRLPFLNLNKDEHL